ncbi:MAG TPA: hypothetical protein VKA67_02150, partial [Verrucomicrobiae bacterium]|nr:hypothetical protein [Verrucomicrobiae bacterium]
WMVFGAVLFVLGWRGLVVVARHLKEPPVVRELCGVRQFAQDLTPNHANTRLVFCEDTQEGVGIYFCDTDGGKPRLLCEQKEKGIRGRRFSMLGWAPDDSLFACAWPDNPHDQEFILIFDGRTGKLLDKIGADPSLEQLAWLSPGAFAYSAAGTSVRVVERQGGGSWVHKRYFGNVATNLDNFVAVPPDSVAWRDRNAIWRLNLDSGKPEKIWEATTNRLVEFTTATDGSGFLLNCSDDLGQYLVWFDPQEKSAAGYGRISNQQNYIRNAVWLDHGTSYAYLTNISAGSAFCIKTGQMEQPVTVPWNGGVRNLTLNGSRLFFAGNPDGQTPGIWEYDIPSQTFKLLDSSAGSPPNDSIGNPPVCHPLTNSFGEQRFYHLWTPLRPSPNKKYPLLLAQELNSWFACFRIAAASGYFVAVVDRPFFNTWNGNPEHSWVQDVNGLYEIMAHNPQVDTNRVYLYACSRETSFLSLLMNEQPALAKGAILFNPTGLPDVSALQNKRILIMDGKLDGKAITRLSEYQNRATQAGNSVTLFLQNDTGHVSASGKTASD